MAARARVSQPKAVGVFYYLQNFRTALAWLTARYADLLSAPERGFIDEFAHLPPCAQALLVRLIMRKGELFRESKIAYAEIGATAAAAAPLIALQWLDPEPRLSLQELFGLLRRSELAQIFGELGCGSAKSLALEALRAVHTDSRGLAQWGSSCRERVYRVSVAPLCTRLRLLFFGNFRQDWSEFVLTRLQIFRYEQVEIGAQSRAFQTREEIEQFYALYDCRQCLAEEAPLDEVLARLPREPLGNEWLEARRAKLTFQIAHEYERRGAAAQALNTYAQCAYPGARLRRLRIMERQGDYHAALELAQCASVQPENDAERQQAPRVLNRIRRHLALPLPPGPQHAPPERLEVSLPQREPPIAVEQAVLAHLARPEAPIFYVENSLINSLFGLLCWEAIFAPVRGAFFHPFHSGPADLWSPSFQRRRQALFERCFSRLEDGSFGECMRRTFDAKQGIQSPFVYWGTLSEELLKAALQCIPAHHLRHCFERLLADLRDHRAGLPDLIQFWPLERRYRMLEVKGPNDRLQDNQRRWLDYCRRLDIPVAVCHVRWT
jgi:hypothetical protein